MTGIELIAEERKRQIEVEGYTAAHDMEHSANDLVCAAIAYLSCNFPQGAPSAWWPFRKQEYKPKDYVSNIKRAAALCAAALDVLKSKMGDAQRKEFFKTDIEDSSLALYHQWHDINDEFPKDDVICTNGLSVGIGKITEDLDCDCDNGVFLCGVTHWMPLPELPKENI